jgi:hypothetical protein
MNDLLRNLLKPFYSLFAGVMQVFVATFQSILKVKMLVRVLALGTALLLWHDNNKKFEQSKAFHAFSVEQGLKSENPDVRKKAREEYRKIKKEQA